MLLEKDGNFADQVHNENIFHFKIHISIIEGGGVTRGGI